MIFHIHSTTLYYTQGRVVNVSLPADIHRGLTVLTGPNGSGKTTFARILERGRNFRTNKIISEGDKQPVVRYMEFNDVHSWTGASVGYYQQRYESGMNDETPTVREIMGDRVNDGFFTSMSTLLNLKGAEDKKINHLSSGELRKLLIINALFESPDLLILDNPFIGLDSDSRKAFTEALAGLRNKGVSIMLLVSDPSEAPSFTDNMLYADSFTISAVPPVTDYFTSPYVPFGFSAPHNGEPGDEILEMTDCKVHYGNVKVLDNINWKIKGGERWSLTGRNGSGKSTLLSLIYADNPKSYANNISLFGKRRGTGESIWDIKRQIGYVSPEMQLYFHGSGTVEHIVANGLNDTVGLFVRPTEEQLELGRRWLRHFKIMHLADRRFNTLSSGERQLTLLARSIIKEPRLLILDEPMHALDPHTRKTAECTIEEFTSSHPESALIMVTHNPAELPASINSHFQLQQHAT